MATLARSVFISGCKLFYRHKLVTPARHGINTNQLTRSFSVSQPSYCAVEETAAEGDSEQAENAEEGKSLRPVIDVETSIRYMKSKAYKVTYKDDPVWVPYRRNHKGAIPPEITRKTCIRKGILTAGNPCPICRDEYLVLHPANVELLKQFISPNSGEVLSFKKTGLCQMQHKNLLIAVHQTWDLGYIEEPIPFRNYDYTQYYPQLKKKSKKQPAK